jgi:release factor glutamine methyltransferase
LADAREDGPEDGPDLRLVATLRSAGCVFAEEEAALLEAEAVDAHALALMVARRVAGEPLEQVVGWAEFCGLRIRVTPGVFVPRRRTARLVEVGVVLLAEARPDAVVVDLCCGTGAIGVAVAAVVSGIELHAADVDPDAVACARLNVEGPGAGTVHEGDLYAALPPELHGRIDLLLVNAPYVPTDEIALMPLEARSHEHHVALDGGADGLDLHRRVAEEATGWLVPGGSLLVETSARQSAATASACTGAGLHVELFGPDDQGMVVVRAISAPVRSSGRMSR